MKTLAPAKTPNLPRSCCWEPFFSRCSSSTSGCGRTASWSSRSPAGMATRRCCPSPRDPDKQNHKHLIFRLLSSTQVGKASAVKSRQVLEAAFCLVRHKYVDRAVLSHKWEFESELFMLCDLRLIRPEVDQWMQSLTSLESILASSLALRMRLTIHLSASSGVMLSLSASMLSGESRVGGGISVK